MNIGLFHPESIPFRSGSIPFHSIPFHSDLDLNYKFFHEHITLSEFRDFLNSSLKI